MVSSFRIQTHTGSLGSINQHTKAHGWRLCARTEVAHLRAFGYRRRYSDVQFTEVYRRNEELVLVCSVLQREVVLTVQFR